MSVRQLRPATGRREALFADPLLTGDLLLIALAWDHLIAAEEPVRATTVCEMTGLKQFRYRSELTWDVPRYEPPDRPSHCQWVGPRGGACQRRGCHCTALHDPEDGTVTWVSACLLSAHDAWRQRQLEAHLSLLGVRTPPKPAYNTRSRLAHHFPEVDFPAWWKKLGGRFGQPYEVDRDPDRGGDVVIQRPKLRLA